MNKFSVEDPLKDNQTDINDFIKKEKPKPRRIQIPWMVNEEEEKKINSICQRERINKQELIRKYLLPILDKEI